MKLFIGGTDTGVGKTWLTRGLARALVKQGSRVIAVKPLETGCENGPPADARAIAAACGRPELADDPAFYRARAALAPYAATLEGEAAPDFERIVARIDALAAEADFTLIEGAGGLRTPIDAGHEVRDLARGASIVLVAADRLGVLSQVLAVYQPNVALCVLTQITPDESTRTNARILSERLACPVFAFPRTADDDDALADAALEISRTLRGP